MQHCRSWRSSTQSRFKHHDRLYRAVYVPLHGSQPGSSIQCSGGMSLAWSGAFACTKAACGNIVASKKYTRCKDVCHCVKVTCHSAIKLKNIKSKFYLHSHEIPYGSGSGQQSVTGMCNSTGLCVRNLWLYCALYAKELCAGLIKSVFGEHLRTYQGSSQHVRYRTE